MPLKSHLASVVSQSTPLSMASPVAFRNDLSIVMVLPPVVATCELEIVVGYSMPGPQMSRLASSTMITTPLPISQ